MVGPIAPILLTVARCMQGISTGGQLAGSFCFVVEIAGPTRGAFFGAVSLAASVIGTALGSLCAAVLHMPSVISEEALQSWGWRVPFLLGLLVGVIAHLIKDSVHEGAAPDELAEAGVNPFKAAITSAWREILLVAGTTGMWSAGFYVITTWVPTFASNPDLIERPLPDAFGINTALMLFSGLVLFPSFGYIATKFTPQATMQGAAVAGTLLCLPSFGLIIQDTTSMLLLGQGALVVVISAYGAPLPSWMVFNTPRQCRYTVIGLGYNLAHATVGGTAPIFSTLLLRWTGSAMSVGLYFGILCVCSGSLLAWNTRSKARRNDIGGDGGGAGGGGRRGYAQLDRASTFDDERDDEIASVGANRRLGQFGDEEVGGISPPTADARATTVERRADANSGTSKDETTSYNAATEPRGDTVDVDERQSLIVAKVPPLPDRAFIEHASDKVLPERHEFVDRPLPLPPPPTPSTERPEMESLDEVASLPGPTAVHSVTAAVVDTHHQGVMGERLRKAGARVGRLTCSLLWNNTDDLDLHCTTPFDEHIHWNNKHGTTCGGHLDVDMNASDHNLSSTPIENMVWCVFAALRSQCCTDGAGLAVHSCSCMLPSCMGVNLYSHDVVLFRQPHMD